MLKFTDKLNETILPAASQEKVALSLKITCEYTGWTYQISRFGDTRYRHNIASGIRRTADSARNAGHAALKTILASRPDCILTFETPKR